VSIRGSRAAERRIHLLPIRAIPGDPRPPNQPTRERGPAGRVSERAVGPALYAVAQRLGRPGGVAPGPSGYADASRPERSVMYIGISLLGLILLIVLLVILL
jgi:hypothetical protein